jgi:hypothetical protein
LDGESMKGIWESSMSISIEVRPAITKATPNWRSTLRDGWFWLGWGLAATEPQAAVLLLGSTIGSERRSAFVSL